MKHTNEIHRIIIGIPLVSVAVFCFGLLTVRTSASIDGQSSPARTTGAVASPEKNPTTEDPKLNALKPLPLASTNLSTLHPVNPANDQSSSNNSIGDSTASPQNANSSSGSNKAKPGISVLSAGNSSKLIPVTAR